MSIQLTLKSYLMRRWTVPSDEQLFLINNPYFYERLTSCIVAPKRSVKFTNFLLKYLGIESKKHPIRIPNKNSILFLGNKTSSYNSLKCLGKIYDLIRKKTKYRYRLIIGKGDYSFDCEKLNGIPDNLEYVVANNVMIENKRVKYLPMGRDFRSSILFQKVLPTEFKQILCYCNFSVNTHPIRQQIYRSIENKEFIVFEHMGQFQNYSISREDNFKQLVNSKFAICPRGNGLDTFRMWDCLYLGTIPIVVKEAVFHNQLEDLPILFLDSPSEYAQLNKEYLEYIYNKMLEQKYNYSKLLLSTWMNDIFKPISNT